MHEKQQPAGDDDQRILFNGAYYQKWTRKSKNPSSSNQSSYTSRIVSIMNTQHGIVVVDLQGKITNYSPEDWCRVVWQGQIQPPPTSDPAKSVTRFGVFHSVYDSVADRFYFVLAALYDDTVIYWASRLAVASSTTNTPAFLDLLKMNEQERAGRHFLGMALDANLRLLYACSCDNDVSLWLLYGYDVGGAKMIGSIDCKANTMPIDPRFCSFQVTSVKSLRTRKSQSSRSTVSSSLTSIRCSDVNYAQPERDNEQLLLLVAVSDFINNGLAIFSVDYNSFLNYVETCRAELVVPSQVDTNELVFTQFIAVSNSNIKRPSQRDSLNGPCEVCFDRVGNLMVADMGNNRLQIFAVTCDVDPEKNCAKFQLESVWQSNLSSDNTISNEVPGLWRVSYGINPKMKKPSAIVAPAPYSEDVPELFYFY